MNEQDKGTRVAGQDRAALTRSMQAQYEGGASIRAIAESSGRSYGFVHRLLSESETPLRGRGGATRGRSATQ